MILKGVYHAVFAVFCIGFNVLSYSWYAINSWQCLPSQEDLHPGAPPQHYCFVYHFLP